MSSPPLYLLNRFNFGLDFGMCVCHDHSSLSNAVCSLDPIGPRPEFTAVVKKACKERFHFQFVVRKNKFMSYKNEN